MNSPPRTRSPTSGKILLSAALAAHLASCARPATDGRSAVAWDPFDLFRDVCGRIGDSANGLALAVETRGLRRARAALVPRFLHGRSGRVWADRRTGEDVFIALERGGAVCTVAARRADLGLALQRFSEHVLDQAGPDRDVVRVAAEDPEDDGRPVRAGFRVTPRPSGAPLAYSLLYTFSGDPSADTDAQLVMRARLAALRS